MQARILPAAPLPGGVKVARRPVKPFGVGASPTLAANLWKAGRYGGRAQAPGSPVPKTGSATPRPEHYWVAVARTFRHLTSTSGDHYDYDAILTQMAAEQIQKTCAAESYTAKQKGPTGPADPAKSEAVLDRISGRPEPRRTPNPLALVICVVNTWIRYEYRRRM